MGRGNGEEKRDGEGGERRGMNVCQGGRKAWQQAQCDNHSRCREARTAR